MSAPIPLAPLTDNQNVVYHIYQHGAVGGHAPSFSVNNFPVSYFLRPFLLFLQWGFWIVYIAGAAKVSSLKYRWAIGMRYVL